MGVSYVPKKIEKEGDFGIKIPKREKLRNLSKYFNIFIDKPKMLCYNRLTVIF